MRLVTDDDIKYILDHANMTNKELSAILGYKWTTIRGVKHRFGITKKHKYDEEDILRRYSECHNASAIATELNLCKKVVLNILHKHGIDTAQLPVLSDNDIEYIIAHYNDLSSSRLAEMFNCSTSKICQVWNQHGLYGKQSRVYSIDESYFDKIDSGEKAYLLGFICADGCLYHSVAKQKQDIIRITIKADDEEILNLFNEAFKCDKPIYYYHRNGNQYAALELVSQRIVDNIKNLGIEYNKTYGNTIPEIDEKYMFDFIRGYFDGDGSISDSCGSNISFSGFQSNCMKIAKFCEQNNIFLSFINDKRKHYKEDSFGSLVTTNLTSKYCLIKSMYKNCGPYKLNRKYKIAMEFINSIESSDDIRHKQIVIYNKYAVQRTI